MTSASLKQMPSTPDLRLRLQSSNRRVWLVPMRRIWAVVCTLPSIINPESYLAIGSSVYQ
ncbi:hypothetical protein N7527_002999 [Penicillium freii]|nr:hypothetical protein N7465_002196 [Penicillium sp. CMV-2018d]KAJ5529606.1 hypothetical protein N7527_002999 [Penicillium freii]